VFLFSGLIAFGWIPAAAGLTHTWTGGTGLWTDSGNWTNGLPAEGGSVVVASGVVTLTGESGRLASFEMTGGQLVFSNGLASVVRADEIRIKGGTVRHAANSATATNTAGQWPIDGRVCFVCTNFFLEAAALIDVNERGWAAPLTGNVGGYGPGAATGLRAGGGYGGGGGNYSKYGGLPYGSTEGPDQPGSGGGAYGSVKGGVGGGLVRIESHGGTVTVNGTIRANGGKGGANAGGGSGGGIYISCRTLAGTNGLVTVNGGDYNSNSGSGSGGRIAVAYEPEAQSNAALCTATFSARMGGYVNYPGDLGTLWFPDNTLLGEMVSHTGHWMAPPGYWTTPSLTVTNGWIRFPADGMRLTVTGDVTVTGAGAGLELGGNASMGKTLFREGTYLNYVLVSAMTNPPELAVGGNLTLTNGGFLRLYSAPTNGAPFGAYLAVTGSLVVGASSALYPVSDPTNGGSVRIGAEAVTVLKNGSINADRAGFSGGRVTVSGEKGFGPGGGATRDGGGYGGMGGNMYNLAGRPYGSAESPDLPGSGGGNNAGETGGAGGGLIWVEARERLTVHGVLTANGATPAGNSAAGSGGGIRLACRTFASSGGVIRASGVAVADSGVAGSGGGGRISLSYDPVQQDSAEPVDVTIQAGCSLVSYPADIGTIYLTDSRFLKETLNMEGQVLPFSAWSPANLIVSNRWVRFPADGFALSVTGGVTITDQGLVELGGAKLFDRDSFILANGQYVGLIHYSAATSSFHCGGSLVLTNGGGFRIFAGPTNGAVAHGAVVRVAGRTEIGAGSWIFPVSEPTNGGSALFLLSNLAVASGGGFDANQSGFAGGGGATWVTGFGYGGGGYSASMGGGGGYGGAGGNPTRGGVVYGDSNAPAYPGSGGGRGNNTVNTRSGGSGGGLIRVQTTGAVVLDGTLTANGRSSTYGAGAGSGGGVYLRCRTLSGAGAIRANGGTATTQNSAASGGGGRVAVGAVNRSAFSGSALAQAGTGGTYNGAEGTVVWLAGPRSGALMVVR
jgi:hypothetical protein